MKQALTTEISVPLSTENFCEKQMKQANIAKLPQVKKQMALKFALVFGILVF